MIWLTDALQNFANGVYRWLPQSTPSLSRRKEAKLVAHRGAWDDTHKENTHQAFARCLQTPVWGIEFDIRWTLDNVPVVHHDRSCRRVFDKDILISETNADDLLSQLPAIPKFQDVVDRYGGQLHLMIELKNQPKPEQASVLKSLLSDLRPRVDYHFMSLDFDHFKTLKEWDPKCWVSIARTNIRDIYHKTMTHNIGGLTGQYLLISGSMKTHCHSQDIKVGTGFPDSKNLLFREINQGSDWIFTNRALELSEHLIEE
ncbi:MAG: glycerophosphodiester phosphodiesterase [Pseudomonadota bacterium]